MKQKFKRKNKWELLFDEFMENVEFQLIKCKDKWKIYDLQGVNLGDIDLDVFTDAQDILDRMDIYIQDYFITDIVENLELYHISKLYHISFVYDNWIDLLQYKNYLPQEYSWEFDILDMICCHADEINLENCNYEEEE